MIIFDVLTDDSPVGWKGERTRLFLTEAGYQKSLENQEKSHIKILSHAKVRQGRLGAVHDAGTGVGQGPVQIKKDRLGHGSRWTRSGTPARWSWWGTRIMT